MAISKYNHAMDYTVLALASAANGEFKKAGKLLLKASKAHDVERAVQILEASNQMAFDQHKAAVIAAAKGKAAPKVAAGKRVSAAQAQAKTKVKAFDMGDEAEIDELIGDGSDIEEEEEIEEAAVEFDEDEDEDEDFDKAFASVLAGMKSSK